MWPWARAPITGGPSGRQRSGAGTHKATAPQFLHLRTLKAEDLHIDATTVKDAHRVPWADDASGSDQRLLETRNRRAGKRVGVVVDASAEKLPRTALRVQDVTLHEEVFERSWNGWPKG